MEGAGHQFLARAALAEDQHGRIGGRHLAQSFQQPLHRGTLPEQALARVHLSPEFAVFLRQPAVTHGALDRHAQLISGERLGQVVEGAFPHRVDRRGHGRMPRHDDHGQPRIVCEGHGQQGHAVGTGHLEIEHESAGCHLAQHFPEPEGIGQRVAFVAVAAEHAHAVFQGGRLVVHEEDAGRHVTSAATGAGTRRTKRAPPALPSSTQMRPPVRSMTPRHTASPSPVPLPDRLVV